MGTTGRKKKWLCWNLKAGALRAGVKGESGSRTVWERGAHGGNGTEGGAPA